MGIISRIDERVRALLTDHGNSALKKCCCRAKLLSRVPQTPVIPLEARIQGFKSRRNSNTRWMPKLLLQSLLSFVVTSVFVLPSVAATSPVGATQGQFQVSESGAANYSIAISLPAQRACSPAYPSPTTAKVATASSAWAGRSAVYPASAVARKPKRKTAYAAR